MEIPIDLPNLCSKVANSDVNSDLDCSDVDFDSDSQNKLATVRDADEKFTMRKRDEACEKLKHMYFTRVSTDSTETDCSFKSQPIDGSVLHALSDHSPDDHKSDSMECDSSKKIASNDFCLVQNVVSSTVDIDIVAKGHCTLDDHNKTGDGAATAAAAVDGVAAQCLPNAEEHIVVCGTVSASDEMAADANISIVTESNENST